jgi:solute carrier family 25 (mitochondrial carnitine/acylcarnitine transporter), member 20/29
MSSSFKLVGEGTSIEEGLSSLFCGALYGITSVVVGHPFDTIKTKMQADPGYSKLTTAQSCRSLFTQQGIRGFYSGAIPPLIGSSMFRSVQFAVYGATYAYFRDEDHILRQSKFFGIEARVFVGGVASGIARALIESPLDYIKTQQQTSGKTVALSSLLTGSKLMTGLKATLVRNFALMTTFFVCISALESLDPFLRGGLATTIGWTTVWPLDVTKSRIQSSAATSTSVHKELWRAAAEGSLYRGYVAGISRSFVANGASLKMYQLGQEFTNKYRNIL